MVSGDSYLVRFIWFPLWELLCFNRIYCVLKGKYKIYMFPIIILAELGEGCELSSFIQKYAGISGLKQENSGEISRSNWWMLVERDEIRTLKSLPSSAWRFPPFLLFNNIWDDIPMTRIVSGVETCWNHQPDLENCQLAIALKPVGASWVVQTLDDSDFDWEVHWCIQIGFGRKELALEVKKDQLDPAKKRPVMVCLNTAYPEIWWFIIIIRLFWGRSTFFRHTHIQKASRHTV
jgi:hypothetical protein